MDDPEAVDPVPDERPAVEDFDAALRGGRLAAPVSALTGLLLVAAPALLDLLVADFFAVAREAEGFELVVVFATVETADVLVVLPTVSAAVAGARRAAWLAVERAGLAAPGTAEVRVSAAGLARRTFAVEDGGGRRVA